MKGILVTGMSRSGTTWVGRMLAATPELAYLHEPTNIDCAWHAWNVGLPHQFMYFDDSTAKPYRARFERILRLRPIWSSLLHTRANPARFQKMLEQTALLANARNERRRPLLKDPLAVFASEWLAREFDLGVVVAVRHPAAVASSRRGLGWRFEFEHLIGQPQFMDLLPASYRAELESLCADPSRDIIDESAMLWKLVYWFVEERLHARERHIVVRHEDLCRDSAGQFESLYGQLDLRFDRSVADVVDEYSSAADSTDPARTDVRRNSPDLIDRWREELDPSEVSRIRHRVGDIANLHYSSHEW
jgi:hypothetical protein